MDHMHAQASRPVSLFLLAGPDAPKLEDLMDIPEGMSVIGKGRPNKECAGELKPWYNLRCHRTIDAVCKLQVHLEYRFSCYCRLDRSAVGPSGGVVQRGHWQIFSH